MVRVLRGGERSEERLQLRPCVSFGHSCCETGLQCQGISQSCAFQLCCHVAPVLLSLSGLRAAIYVCICVTGHNSRLLPASDFTLLLFHSFGFSFVIAAADTQKYTEKTALRMNPKKTKQNTKYFSKDFRAERERQSLLGL